MEYTKIFEKSLTKKRLLVTFNYAKAAEAFTGLLSRLFRNFSKRGSVQCEGGLGFLSGSHVSAFIPCISLSPRTYPFAKTLAKFRPPLLIFAERRPGFGIASLPSVQAHIMRIRENN